MKKFAKFIPVALGLLTLVSCSNDEIFSESQNAVEMNDGDILVTMTEPQEDGQAFTRGYTSRDMKSRRWYSGIDKLSAYGSQFGAWDTYMFRKVSGESSGVFELVSDPSYVKEPMWALYPQEQIINGKWNFVAGLYNSTATVDVVIPQSIEYDAAYDASAYATNKEPYYLDNLPRWGKITKINSGMKLETNLSWMTGILRLQLAGAPKYSNGIMVQMFENGDRTKPIRLNSVNDEYWTVKIAQNDEPVPGACVEYKAGDYADNAYIDGALYVWMKPEGLAKLNEEDRDKAVIYLPLPVTTGKNVDIVVSVWDYAVADKHMWNRDIMTGTTNYLPGITFASCWKEQAVYKNKTIKLGYVYGNAKQYNLAIDGTNPGAISDALELFETTDKIIHLTAKNPIDVCSGDQQTTIEIPNRADKDQIIIDLREGLDGCAAGETLNIVYKDVTKPFVGNVTLITPDAPGTNPVKLNVDLDKSSFSIVQGQALKNDAYGDIDVDAREFVVGNTDPSTPTPAFKANYVKLSKNVEKFWVASQASINGFVIDRTGAEANWKHGGIKEILINGVAGIGGGAIDAKTNVEDTYEVLVTIDGDNSGANDVKTLGEVNIIGGGDATTTAVIDDIEAKKVTASGWATTGCIGNVAEPITETISLSGHVTTVPGAMLVADGDISIIEEANVPSEPITSNKGNITINNAYTTATSYTGAITADKGFVSLNQVGTVRASFSGDITANVFSMTGLTRTTGDVTAHGTATIDVDPQDGDCPAIGGSLTLDHPTANVLNLTTGYVKKIVNDFGETSLTFSSDPDGAYAAIAQVTTPKKLIPTNTSIWNGDADLKAFPNFAAWHYNIDGSRIWTATQLGHQIATATTGTIDIRTNIDLANKPWAGIEAGGDVTIKGNDKTISHLNLTGNKDNRYAGFYNTNTGDLTVNNLKFDEVKTTISGITGGVYEHGIGAVAGRLESTSTLNRVEVKLAGGNFGTVPTKNVQTAGVGGLIGVAVGAATLIGCQVDASGAALTGHKQLGGFIGQSMDAVDIRMATGDEALGIADMYPSVTGLTFYVTYDASKTGSGVKNDPYQGSTGWFIGSINPSANLTVADINQKTELKRNIVQAPGSLANEKVASRIENINEYYWFMRNSTNSHQTLVGNSGFDVVNGSMGVFTILGQHYYIFKLSVPQTMDTELRLYSLVKDAYLH